MNFEGHEIYKLNRNWIFDLTTFTGYKVYFKNEKIIKAEKAFKVKDTESDLEFIKYIESIPIGVLRKSSKVIKKYYKEALISE